MTSVWVLRSQPQYLATRNGRPLREFAATPGRPSRQVTAGVTPLHQKSQLVKAGLVLRVAVAVSLTASSLRMILHTVEASQ